jgi:hypothetical protein
MNWDQNIARVTDRQLGNHHSEHPNQAEPEPNSECLQENLTNNSLIALVVWMRMEWPHVELADASEKTRASKTVLNA